MPTTLRSSALRSTRRIGRGLDDAFAATAPIPGDCGDEYRRPPYLTASGDLSHHLGAIASGLQGRADAGPAPSPAGVVGQRLGADRRLQPRRPGQGHDPRLRDHRNPWRRQCVAPGDAGAQTTYILDKIAASIAALGGTMDDVVRTRIYLRDASQWEPVSRAHGRFFGEIKPSNTLVEAGDLVGDYEVEIEAEAVVD